VGDEVKNKRKELSYTFFPYSPEFPKGIDPNPPMEFPINQIRRYPESIAGFITPYGISSAIE
jgi:hypothetical protein